MLSLLIMLGALLLIVAAIAGVWHDAEHTDGWCMSLFGNDDDF